MPREKFSIGEHVEVRCDHVKGGRLVHDWLSGVVVDADYRMVAIQFDVDVFSSNGWLIPDRILWCAHGSPNLRRPDREQS